MWAQMRVWLASYYTSKALQEAGNLSEVSKIRGGGVWKLFGNLGHTSSVSPIFSIPFICSLMMLDT